MPEIVMVVLSLVCLMVANIIMGKKLADFKDEYNKEKFSWKDRKVKQNVRWDYFEFNRRRNKRKNKWSKRKSWNFI